MAMGVDYGYASGIGTAFPADAYFGNAISPVDYALQKAKEEAEYYRRKFEMAVESMRFNQVYTTSGTTKVESKPKKTKKKFTEKIDSLKLSMLPPSLRSLADECLAEKFA